MCAPQFISTPHPGGSACFGDLSKTRSLYTERHFLFLFAQQAQGNQNTSLEITFVVAIVAFV